jgi:hypothetical protein
MRSIGLPTPKLKGFSLLQNWQRLSFEEKLRSTLGTIRRAIHRRYFQRLHLHGKVNE